MRGVEWRDSILGDFLEVKHGFAFRGQYFGPEGSHIVLTPGNFYDQGGFKDKGEEEKRYSGPIPPEYVLHQGDIVIAMTEQAEGLLGSSAVIPRDNTYLHNQRIGLLKFKDPPRSQPRFFYYLFNCPWVRAQIRATASGAKIRHTAPGRVAAVRVGVPSYQEQSRIADLLGAYDALVSNNLRRIQILEEMARATYREWFLNLRFPGHESARMRTVGGMHVPEGWAVGTVGDIAEEMRRNVPKGDLGRTVPYVGLEHIPRHSLALDSWQEVGDLGSNKLAFQRGEVLFGKIRPYFHKVCVAPFDGVCSADTIVLRARHPEHYALMVAVASSDEFVAYASATANGAKMPRANWGVLSTYSLLLPPAPIAARFSELFNGLADLQQVLVRQILNLRATRDRLLPRLMSGRLTLPEAEKAAAAAL